MKYFQTDDRDDYFDSLRSNNKPKKWSTLTVKDPSGKIILNHVMTYQVRKYIKGKYPEYGNAKRVWRTALQSKGYTVINNIENT